MAQTATAVRPSSAIMNSMVAAIQTELTAAISLADQAQARVTALRTQLADLQKVCDDLKKVP